MSKLDADVWELMGSLMRRIYKLEMAQENNREYLRPMSTPFPGRIIAGWYDNGSWALDGEGFVWRLVLNPPECKGLDTWERYDGPLVVPMLSMGRYLAKLQGYKEAK